MKLSLDFPNYPSAFGPTSDPIESAQTQTRISVRSRTESHRSTCCISERFEWSVTTHLLVRRKFNFVRDDTIVSYRTPVAAIVPLGFAVLYIWIHRIWQTVDSSILDFLAKRTHASDFWEKPCGKCRNCGYRRDLDSCRNGEQRFTGVRPCLSTRARDRGEPDKVCLEILMPTHDDLWKPLL